MFYEGCTVEEIRAYRELESETFNFGEGDMKIQGWYGSEDAYYEMCLPEECGYNSYMEEYYQSPKVKLKKGKKHKLNYYARKQIGRKKLDKLYDEAGWWTVCDKGTHKVRCYIGSSKHHKKYSNKKVRQYKGYIGSGSSYRKLYDYWWEVL